ncbi:MAG: hypothetical protein QW776_03180 [Candidatus Nitrosocaldus sp.]
MLIREPSIFIEIIERIIPLSDKVYLIIRDNCLRFKSIDKHKLCCIDCEMYDLMSGNNSSNQYIYEIETASIKRIIPIIHDINRLEILLHTQMNMIDLICEYNGKKKMNKKESERMKKVEATSIITKIHAKKLDYEPILMNNNSEGYDYTITVDENLITTLKRISSISDEITINLNNDGEFIIGAEFPNGEAVTYTKVRRNVLNKKKTNSDGSQLPTSTSVTIPTLYMDTLLKFARRNGYLTISLGTNKPLKIETKCIYLTTKVITRIFIATKEYKSKWMDDNGRSINSHREDDSSNPASSPTPHIPIPSIPSINKKFVFLDLLESLNNKPLSKEEVLRARLDTEDFAYTQLGLKVGMLQQQNGGRIYLTEEGKRFLLLIKSNQDKEAKKLLDNLLLSNVVVYKSLVDMLTEGGVSFNTILDTLNKSLSASAEDGYKTLHKKDIYVLLAMAKWCRDISGRFELFYYAR